MSILLHLIEDKDVDMAIRYKRTFVIREDGAGRLEIVRAGAALVDADRSLTIAEIKGPITLEVEHG